MTIQYLKLEIFIPATHFRILQKALQSADAGHIGNYDSCLSYSPVKETKAMSKNAWNIFGSGRKPMIHISKKNSQ